MFQKRIRSEFIAAIARDAIDDILATSTVDMKDVYFAQREQLESNEAFAHPISYDAIARFVDGDYDSSPEILVYERLAGGNEAGLHGKISIGFGGHIDYPKTLRNVSLPGNEPNFWHILAEARDRELSEELGLTEKDIEIPGAWFKFIFEPHDPVGKFHLGMGGLTIVKPDFVPTTKETDQIKYIGWYNMDLLLELLQPDKTIGLNGKKYLMENWSVILLSYLAKLYRAYLRKYVNQETSAS